MSGEHRQRGLLKLMLKLPALRGKLQLLSARDPSLQSLFEAYDEATSMLDRQRSSQLQDRAVLTEYELICREIEEEVIAICLFNEDQDMPGS
ncbi:hypothetical protein J2Z50_005147 [Ensifer mexicanus]|nr:hypothetical protein [Sinorhizobium mexicanum]MBP1886844.1 hypothetical protein [Sinorhizobium mexicanum]